MIFAAVFGSSRVLRYVARSNPRPRWLSVIVVLAMLPVGTTARVLRAQPPATDELVEEEPSPYVDWVEQLGSDQYALRERASRQLFEAGPVAVPRLESAIRRGDLETSERALQILHGIAMRQDPGQPGVAWDALTRLTATGSGSAATRARKMLSVVARQRIARAREALSEAGIKVDLNGYVLQASASSAEVLHITDSWNGDQDALAWIPWLYGIEFALLEGSSIDGKVIEQVVEMPDLRNVVFSKTKIAEENLSRLARMSRIDTLELRYVPIGDQAAPKLATLPLRNSLSLIGTEISSQGVDALREALPGLKIEFKRGGFLGVEYQAAWADRCEISRVVPGGAAERAGLQARDIITKVDDVQINTFTDLQEEIGMHAPEDPITISYERLGQLHTTELTLGQLPGAPE